MSIQQQIKEELKEAMKNRAETQLLVLRSLLSGFTNELVAQNKKPQEELTDIDALNVIKKAVKQRKDSIEQFKKGGREDLVDNEEKELKFLEKYLPEMISVEKIKEIAINKQSELGAEDISKIGVLIGAVMGEIKKMGEETDGNIVKKVVEELFE